MPMSPRLLRPISTTHPEAQAWRNAVIANGGTVSGSTLNAVSKFCRAIDAAGIRDKFYRLNLFAGTGLNAALVPLYRGQSRTGTQYGNAADTNNGPFVGVGTDYEETGASGGLTGNGTSKFLDTGLPANTLPQTTSGHAAVYCPNRSSRSAFSGMIGVNVGSSGGFGLSSDVFLYGIWGAFAFTGNNDNGLLLASRTSSTLLTTYVNAQSIVTNTSSVTPSASSLNVTLFGNRANASTVTALDNRRYGFYSFGEGLSQQNVTDLNNAVNAFQTALGRNV